MTTEKMRKTLLFRNGRFLLSLVFCFATGYFIGHCSYHGIKAMITSTSSKSPTEDPFSAEGILNIEVLEMNLFSQKGDEMATPAIWTALNSESENPSKNEKNVQDHNNTVWVVTPTYRRPEQLAELTRLAQALYPVRGWVYWLVIDEYEKGSELNLKRIDRLLKTFPIRYILKRSTPRTGREKITFNPKGVDARNEALRFFRQNLTFSNSEDVVYFADDDNTYDSDIFKQMRSTKGISMWPTGAITGLGLSSPLVRNGEVDGFIDGFIYNRKFPVDFAMFAVTVGLIRDNPQVRFQYIAGYIETLFLQHLTRDASQNDYSFIEPLANNCTDILTWHTKNFKIRPYVTKRNKNWFHLKINKFKSFPNIAKLYRDYFESDELRNNTEMSSSRPFESKKFNRRKVKSMN